MHELRLISAVTGILYVRRKKIAKRIAGVKNMIIKQLLLCAPISRKLREFISFILQKMLNIVNIKEAETIKLYRKESHI